MNLMKKNQSKLESLDGKAYLEPSRTSTMDCFCENSLPQKVVNYLRHRSFTGF